MHSFIQKTAIRLRKLGVQNSIEAIRLGQETGLLS